MFVLLCCCCLVLFVLLVAVLFVSAACTVLLFLFCVLLLLLCAAFPVVCPAFAAAFGSPTVEKHTLAAVGLPKCQEQIYNWGEPRLCVCQG